MFLFTRHPVQHSRLHRAGASRSCNLCIYCCVSTCYDTSTGQNFYHLKKKRSLGTYNPVQSTFTFHWGTATIFLTPPQSTTTNTAQQYFTGRGRGDVQYGLRAALFSTETTPSRRERRGPSERISFFSFWCFKSILFQVKLGPHKHSGTTAADSPKKQC